MKRVCALILAVVLGLSMLPVDAMAASKKVVTVSTQKKLDAALKDEAVTRIIICTTKERTFTIKKRYYDDKRLEVKGKKLTIKNGGQFKSVTITDAKNYSESASGNKITVSDSKLKMTVTKSGVLKKLVVAKAKSQLSLTVNGQLKALEINKKSDVVLTKGSTKKAIPVLINAKDTKVTSSVAIKVTAKADARVVLKAGAEKSAVEVASDKSKVVLENETAEAIVITTPSGSEVVDAGSDNEPLKPEDKPATEDKNTETENTESTEKPEETKPEDKPSSPSGPSSPSRPSIPSGPSSPSGPSTPTYTLMKVSTVAEFESAIQQTNQIQLKSDLTGDIRLEYSNSADLSIDFQSYVIDGNLTLSAPNATSIKLLDAANGGNGAIITGNLTVDAPKAHVENNIKVNGTVVIKGVANSTFAAKDDAGKYSVEGPGRLAFPEDTVATAEVEIKTDAPVLLDGTIETVKVSDANANVEVVAGSSISEVKIEATASTNEESSVKISGSGSVQSVDAKAPVVVEVENVEEVKASAPVVINTAVPTVVVESDEAKVTVGSDAAVTNIAVSAVVTKVEVAGEGTVKAIDTTAAEAAGAETVAIKVSDEAKVSEVVATAESSVSIEVAEDKKPVVKTVKEVTLSTEGAKLVYSSSDSLDLSSVKITVHYSNDETETIQVLPSMVTGLPTAADIVSWEGTREKELTVTYGGKTATYGITFTATLADRLIAAAKSEIKTVECSSTYTIPKNVFVTIPKGVTLKLVGTNVLDIEAGGSLSIEGALQTESEEAIIFHPVNGYTAFSLLFAGGSWVNGSVTHSNTNNESGQWQLLYTDRRDSDEGSPNMLWLVRGELSISGSEFDWEYEASKYLLNSENAKVLLNGKVVDETTPYEKLQFQLRWADEGDVVICDDVIDVPENAWLEIPLGVTLKFTQKGQLIVHNKGDIGLYGVLDTTANDNFLSIVGQPNQFGYYAGEVYIRGGSWKRSDGTYTSKETHRGIFASETESYERWIMWSDLYITSNVLKADSFEERSFDYQGRGLKVFLNNVRINGTTSPEYDELVAKLENAQVGDTVYCDVEVDVPNNLNIDVPEGVTLKFSGSGKLIIHDEGDVIVCGVLDTTENTNFLSVVGQPDSLGIYGGEIYIEGGTWVRQDGSFTSKSTHRAIFTSETGDYERWIMWSDLYITSNVLKADSFEERSFDDQNPEVKAYLNDTLIHEVPAFNKLSMRLQQASWNGGTVVVDEEVVFPEGIWLQIPEKVTLKLSESGKLVVSEWGGMNIWEGATLEVTANEDAFLESMNGTIGLRNGTWICNDATYFSEQSFLHANGSQGVEKCWRVDKDLFVTSESLSAEDFSGDKSKLTSEDAKIYLNDKVVREATAFEKLQIQLNSAEEDAVIECSEEIGVVFDLYIPSGVTLKITASGSLKMSSGSKLRISENACLDTSEAPNGGIDRSGSVTVYMSGTWKQRGVTYSTTSGADVSAGVCWKLPDSLTDPISCLLDMDLYIIADENDLSSINAISFNLVGDCVSAEIYLNDKLWKTLPVSTE